MENGSFSKALLSVHPHTDAHAALTIDEPERGLPSAARGRRNHLCAAECRPDADARARLPVAVAPFLATFCGLTTTCAPPRGGGGGAVVRWLPVAARARLHTI